jgi:hypothetical protein
VIGKAPNMSLYIVYLVEGKATENLKDIPFILVGWFAPIDSTFNNLYATVTSLYALSGTHRVLLNMKSGGVPSAYSL